jgi:sterol O-acyltransferase
MPQIISPSKPPGHSRSSSIGSEPQLIGQLDSDGTASLQVDSTYVKANKGQPPRSLKAALNAAAQLRRESSTSDSVVSDASEEDYDVMKHDPTTVVIGAKGGGFVTETSESSVLALNGKKIYEDIIPNGNSRPGPTRMKSIPITLNKLKEKGRYILTADDAALREILKAGIERVSVNV